MSNPTFKDADLNKKYLSASGAGTDGDPFVAINEVIQATHDDLNANANLQIGDTDVSTSNPVPISDSGGSITVDGPLTDTQLRASAVPISGALTDTQLRAADVKISLDGETVTVSGPLTDTQMRAADVKVSLDSEAVVLGAGSAIVGATTDAGPSQTVTRTYTASADMSTAADISPAPASGQKIVAMDILISTDTAMSFSVQEATSATVFAKVFLPANGSAHITLRGYIKTAVADRKLQGKASVAGNVAVTVVSFSEA